jgi:hypothetical protein
MGNGLLRAVRMRQWVIVGVAWAVMHLAVPRDAFALFEWLDHLSGPGPFRGEEYYARLFCVMDRPSPTLVAEVVADLETVVSSLSPSQSTPLGQQIQQYKLDLAGETSTTRKSFTATREERRLDFLNPELNPAPRSLFTTYARAKRIGDAARSGATDPGLPELQRQQLIALSKAVEDITRQATVPRVRRAPGFIGWADCRDTPFPKSRLSRSGFSPVETRGDRNPVFSMSVHYRRYTTGSVRPLELLGIVRLRAQNRDEWAGGQDVTMKTLTLQGSWPLTGRLDILDGSAAIGMYRFASEGFDQPFHGWIVEPVRVDLHVPARVFDDTKKPVLKVLYSMSLRWGFMTFPGGIGANKFKATGSAVGKDVSEVIFDWGIGWNVGRLLGL